MQRYDKAIQLHQQALNIVQQQAFQLVPYATSLNNLASAYQALGRFEEAEMLLQEAVKTFEENQCHTHPFYISTLNTLAGVYFSQQHYIKAEQLYRRVLDFYKKLYGPYCREYASTAHNLGILYVKIESYPKAYTYICLLYTSSIDSTK